MSNLAVVYKRGKFKTNILPARWFTSPPQGSLLGYANFAGEFLGVFDFLRCACSLGIPQQDLGVSKRGFLWAGGGISIIGVVRAPVAIINFALFARGLLIESYTNSEILTEN